MTVIRGKLSGGHSAEILLEREQIAEVVADPAGRLDQSAFDESLRIAPGFIDIQVNGFAGIDFNHSDFSGDDLVDVCRQMLTTGVTRFCPTLITAEHELLARNIAEILKASKKHRLVRDMVLGIHLEGPYINAEDGPRGAHPVAHVADPDWDEFDRLRTLGQGLLRMVTVAPELPGCLGFIKKATQTGIVVGIGHCNPAPHVVDQAVRDGARISTHLGNGTHKLLDRHQNYLQKQLAHDGLMASIICDGPHLPDYLVKNMVRAKGRSKIILITDATAASGAPPGRYTLGGLDVEADAHNALRLAETPYLAGSTLTMERAVGNCAKFARIALASAIKMATENPAKLFEGITGKVVKGHRADLVLYRTDRKEIEIEQVYLAGRLMYSAEDKKPN